MSKSSSGALHCSPETLVYPPIVYHHYCVFDRSSCSGLVKPKGRHSGFVEVKRRRSGQGKGHKCGCASTHGKVSSYVFYSENEPIAQDLHYGSYLNLFQQSEGDWVVEESSDSASVISSRNVWSAFPLSFCSFHLVYILLDDIELLITRPSNSEKKDRDETSIVGFCSHYLEGMQTAKSCSNSKICWQN